MPSGDPERDLARVREYCEEKSPEHLTDRIRIEYRVRGRTVTIVQHELFMEDWLDLMVARMKYDPGAERWTLYWPDRNGRFHRYEDLPPGSIWSALGEIDDDPFGIFWG